MWPCCRPKRRFVLCKGGGRRGARRGLGAHERQKCAVATACTTLVGLVLTCAAGAASAVGALSTAPFRRRACAAASAPDAIVPALAADAALPVRADDATPSLDGATRAIDGAGPASTSLECASASRCKTSCAPAATRRNDDDAEPRTGTRRRRRVSAMPAAHLAALLMIVVFFCFCVKRVQTGAGINQQNYGAHWLISTQVRAPPTSTISPGWTCDRQCRK